MKEAGLQSLPGGGAEIFHPDVRNEICADKVDGDGWLKIHETAHQLGMHSNATMLYGHIEKYEHRVDHMSRLRQLQDHGARAIAGSQAGQHEGLQPGVADRQLAHPVGLSLDDHGAELIQWNDGQGRGGAGAVHPGARAHQRQGGQAAKPAA
jgi:hypothetical protein